jgi:hypothetical protein
MSLQLILLFILSYYSVLPRFLPQWYVMYPFARFPFAQFLEDIVQIESPMIRSHTCAFTHTNLYVIDQSYDFLLTTWYSSYLSHPLRFLAYLLNLYVDTWSCLHVCPLLAYYGESYFAQHRRLHIQRRMNKQSGFNAEQIKRINIRRVKTV